MRARIARFISIVQSILFAVHFFLYLTWMFFVGTANSSRTVELRLALALLSVSFVLSSILARVYFNLAMRAFYIVASVWLGFVNFFFMAACACWIVYGVPLLFGVHLEKRPLGFTLLGLGLLAGISAIVNAAWTRVVRVTVKLPNLPIAWRGRTAALISDLHLGHVRNAGFLRRIVRKLSQLHPDILFIPGDMFDGTIVDFDRLAKPWAEFSAPLGSYFIAGNHEQFFSPDKFFDAVKQCGIRIIENEKIVVDGLQIAGVHYLDSRNKDRFQSILQKAELDPNLASVLLIHEPNVLPIAADAGISFQVSGHTHRGQFFPFTKIVSRIFGKYAYGLNRFGDLQVYTSCGVGTWGPPMRLGSNPEIVLIRFE